MQNAKNYTNNNFTSGSKITTNIRKFNYIYFIVKIIKIQNHTIDEKNYPINNQFLKIFNPEIEENVDNENKTQYVRVIVSSSYWGTIYNSTFYKLQASMQDDNEFDCRDDPQSIKQ